MEVAVHLRPLWRLLRHGAQPAELLSPVEPLVHGRGAVHGAAAVVAVGEEREVGKVPPAAALALRTLSLPRHVQVVLETEKIICKWITGSSLNVRCIDSVAPRMGTFSQADGLILI